MTNTKHTTPGGVDYYRVNCDAYGNSRYVIHFTALPFRDRNDGEEYVDYIAAHYANTKRLVFGTKYRAKWYGGGVVFTAPESAAARIDAALTQ